MAPAPFFAVAVPRLEAVPVPRLDPVAFFAVLPLAFFAVPVALLPLRALALVLGFDAVPVAAPDFPIPQH